MNFSAGGPLLPVRYQSKPLTGSANGAVKVEAYNAHAVLRSASSDREPWGTTMHRASIDMGGMHELDRLKARGQHPVRQTCISRKLFHSWSGFLPAPLAKIIW